MRIRLREEIITTDIGYHVTPEKNLKNILKKGIINKDYYANLNGERIRKKGKNYFWLDYSYAEWYAKENSNPSYRDDPKDEVILKVNLKGIELQADPEAKDMRQWGAKDNKGKVVAVFTPEPISADRILGIEDTFYVDIYGRYS